MLYFPSSPDNQAFICPACYALRVQFKSLDRERIQDALTSMTTQALSRLHVAVSYSGSGHVVRGGEKGAQECHWFI